MNELLKIMAYDMGIRPYDSESVDSYSFRVIYSALGLWCLKSALSETGSERGISKHSQTILLHKLLSHYISLCPDSKKRLSDIRNNDVAFFIRSVYEQTGYLLTLDNNYNVLNKSGETVAFSNDDYLFLGIPHEKYSVNGLGIHCSHGNNTVGLNDFLVRDSLTTEAFLTVNFDECDFEEKDLDLDELEFFNPCYFGKSSAAWSKHMHTDMTIARKNSFGPYYRVRRDEDGRVLFADENNSGDTDLMTGAEFRRLYVTLKYHYDNPMQILVCPIDEKYSHIKVLGQLPNREYYYFLMNAWPKNNYLDRYNFIVRNELVPQTTSVLEAIGFSVRKGEFYG